MAILGGGKTKETTRRGSILGKSSNTGTTVASDSADDNQRKYVEGMKNSRLMEVDTLKTKQAEEKATKDTMKTLGIDLAGNVKRFGEFKSGIDANQKVKDDKKSADRQKLLDSRADTRKNLPSFAKKILSGVDVVADKIKPATDIAESLYTPAAGLTAINGLTKGASFGLSKLFPKLAGSFGGRATQTALTEGIVGAPLGLANTLAQNPEASNRELLLNTALGAGGGAILGGGGKLLGEGIKAGLRGGTKSLLAPALESSSNIPKFVSGTEPIIARRASSITTEPIKARGMSPVERFDYSNKALYNAIKDYPMGFGDDLNTNIDLIPNEAERTNVRELFNKRNEAEKALNAVRTSTPASSGIPEQAATSQTAATTERVIGVPSPLRTTINERGNIETQRAGNLSDEFNQGLNARDNTYERITNAESVAKANDNVKNLSDAEARFLGNKEFSAEHVATGYRLLQELDRIGETQRALNISEKLAADLTSAGQTAQAASILKRLSPEGQLLHLQRVASSAGKEIAEADAKLYTDLARDVQAGSTTGKETSDFLNVLTKLKAGQEVTPDEMLKATAILEDAKKFIKSGRQSPERLPREMKDVRTRDKVVSFLDEAEQSALARIKARRNQLNALPLGEWADHAIVASSQIAKGTIKAATYVEDMVRLFGEEVRPYAKAIYTEARKLLNGSSKNISEGNVKEASEAFERLRNSQTPAGKVAEKFIKESEIKPGDVEKLRDLAKQLNDLKGKSAQEADMQMQAILNKYQKAGLWDRIQAIRYISMLFNTSTQTVNALSGPIMATTNYAADLVGGIIDMTISGLSRGSRQRTTQIYAANPLKFIARYIKNAGTGAKAGWKGVSPGGITGTGDIRGLTYKSLYNPLGLLERSLGAVSKGADYATYKTVSTGELERQGKLAANRAGVKGPERKEFIEKFMLNPPDEALEIADRVGKNVTFQRMDRAGGKVANSINNSHPLLKIPANTIVPFVKTPLNIAEHAVDLTPVGAIRGIIKLSQKGVSEAERRDAIQRLGLSLVGGGLSATGFYLNQIGVITGNNESGDIDVDKLKESVGQGKYRLNVDGLGRYARAMLGGKGFEAAERAAKYQSGDSQIDYNKFQPLALPIAAGAAASEHGKDGIEKQLESVAVDAGSSLFSMSALRGIQDAFQAPAGVTGAEKATAPIKKVFESFIKSFSPGLLAQETNRRDDIVRKVSYNEGILQNVKEYFMSRTPGLSTKLPPKVDYFGSDVKKPSGFVGAYLNPYRSQVASNTPAARKLAEIYDETGDKGVAPGTLNNSFKGKDAKSGEVVNKNLDKDAYAKLQKKLGELQSTMINKIPDNLTPEQKAYLVDEIYEFTRKGATLAAKQQLGIKVED